MRVRLRVEDTRLEPAACVNSFRALVAEGAKLIIGPQSSAEAAAILPLMKDAGVICISQGSTAATLSLSGDNLFRWVPDDVLEAEAVVALAKFSGVRTLVPAWRGDAGNRGLAVSVRKGFQDAGGMVTPGIEYSVDAPNFTAVVQRLSAEIAAAQAPAAIYLAAFDEVVDLFRAASGDPRLGTVPWYGSDGVVFSVPLASDLVAAAFAERTGYASPTLLRPNSARPKWEPLVKATTEAIAIEPDAFALAAHDAFWCAMTARLLAGTSDIAAWKSYLTFAAESFFGNTGWARLNEHGDRAFGDYEFWGLRTVDGKPDWVPVARFEEGVASRE